MKKKEELTPKFIASGLRSLAMLIKKNDTVTIASNEMMYEMIQGAQKLLKRNEPQRIESEGGGYSWWYVCPECHGAIDEKDSYCRHCGQAVCE